MTQELYGCKYFVVLVGRKNFIGCHANENTQYIDINMNFSSKTKERHIRDMEDKNE